MSWVPPERQFSLEDEAEKEDDEVVLNWPMLPVVALLGETQESPMFKEFMSFMKEAFRTSIDTTVPDRQDRDWKPPELKVDERWFDECYYLNVRAFGLSFCFDGPGKKKTLVQELLSPPPQPSRVPHFLGAIHVFSGHGSPGYSQCPLELPHDVNFRMRARDVVAFLGEPDRKSGGGTVPVCLSYLRLSPKLEVEFLYGNWYDPYNIVSSFTYF